MNAAQNRRYFFEWGQLRDCLRARGLTYAQCEAFRHKLTVQAAGRQKSHMEFTDSEFTEWRKKCAAARQPDSLSAQLEIEDSEDALRERKMEACLDACWDLYTFGSHNGLNTPERSENYVAGIAARVIKKSLDQCTSADLAKVLGILHVQVTRAKNEHAARTAAATGGGASGSPATNPF